MLQLNLQHFFRVHVCRGGFKWLFKRAGILMGLSLAGAVLHQ